MTPLYVANEPFGPGAGEAWDRYLAWSGLRHLRELVSLDAMLCPTVLPEVADEDWPHVVGEDMRLHLFRDLAHLRHRLAGVDRPYRLLCAFLEPERPPEPPPGAGLAAFAGHDLVERATGVSALTNCGGFPDAFAPGDLNAMGLIPDLGRAREIEARLRGAYPEEPHADCELWALFVLGEG